MASLHNMVSILLQYYCRALHLRIHKKKIHIRSLHAIKLRRHPPNKATSYTLPLSSRGYFLLRTNLGSWCIQSTRLVAFLQWVGKQRPIDWIRTFQVETFETFKIFETFQIESIQIESIQIESIQMAKFSKLSESKLQVSSGIAFRATTTESRRKKANCGQ